LKNKVWEDRLVSDDVLAVCIHRLRKAIERDPANPVYIETIKGIGYRFNGKPIHASWRSLSRGSSDGRRGGRCPICGSIIT
jgi:DNA-binding winged helix-turn-helix (wHTH) protein